jgi:hypothetical protein
VFNVRNKPTSSDHAGEKNMYQDDMGQSDVDSTERKKMHNTYHFMIGTGLDGNMCCCDLSIMNRVVSGNQRHREHTTDEDCAE